MNGQGDRNNWPQPQNNSGNTTSQNLINIGSLKENLRLLGFQPKIIGDKRVELNLNINFNVNLIETKNEEDLGEQRAGEVEEVKQELVRKLQRHTF